MKLDTHMQGPNTNTLAKFQGHHRIITSFTPHMCHMCDIQGHLRQTVNIAIYPYDHFRM